MKKLLLSLGVIVFFLVDVNGQALVADAGPDTTACPGAQITFGGSPTASGGTGPYSYSWGSDVGHGNSSLANPTYNVGGSLQNRFWVIVTDNLGAQATDTAVVTVLPGLTFVLLTVLPNPTCVGQAVSFDASTDGTPPYTYLYDFGDGSPASTLPNPQHTYATSGTFLSNLTLTDAVGCSGPSGEGISVNFCGALVADAGPTQAICLNSTFTLGGNPTATGGTPPYSYAWAGPASFTSTLANPLQWTLGTYTLTVTDALSNTATASVNISGLPVPIPNAGTNQTVCIGNCITLGGTPTASGGQAPYTYAWAPGTGLSSSSISNPTACPQVNTTYTVTVTDINGCSALDAIVITVQNCSGFSATTQDVTCFGSCDGSATVTSTGNSNYLWSNSQTTATINNLCAGNYSVTVMDSIMNPLDTLIVTISQPNPMMAQPVQVVDVTCFGMSNGFAQVIVTGGTPPYMYIWNNGSVTQFLQNLPAGTYSVTVMDNNQCTAIIGFTINQPSPISVSAISTAESVTGACDGSIDVTANGGVMPFNYNWSNAATTEDLANICAGNYTVTITDSNGCTVTATDVVSGACPSNTIVLTLTSTGDLDCTHAADTITAIVSGGNPAYTYLWSNNETTQSIIVTQAGVYTFWVTDSNGCVRTSSDTVLNLGVVVTLQSATPVTCNGINNGKVKVVVSGGVAPYTYLWSNGAVADSIVGIPSATYTLTVTDAASCTATFSYFLNQSSTNWSYYAYVNSTNANCSNNGTATVNVSGGTGPFTYLWNTTPAQTTQTAIGLAGGSNYTVTVTGSDGCTRTGNAYVYTSCYNIITGRLIRDLNGNCVLDSGETPLANYNVIADGTTDYYGNTNAQGYYTITALSGTYVVRPSNPGVCLVSCNGSNTSFTHAFSGLGDTVSNVNFYLVPAPFNLYASHSSAAFRPGFTATVYIYHGNVGTDTVGGTVTFTYDNDLTYVSSSNNAIHHATNRTLTWTLANIIPRSNYNYYNSYFTANFQTPVGTPVGTLINNNTRITSPLAECDTNDNRYNTTATVTNSYDPNEKVVSPAGDIFEEDSMLTYTIRFQNTGNDTAWFVVLKDTLSAALEPGSVQNINASHDITEFTISEMGILTWVFNPIYLVDSNTNEPASHGYVTFRVKKKSNLPLTTAITNTAHIYFDYNEPVVTNTVTNTLTEPILTSMISAEENISVSAMPNPFTQATQIVVEGINSAFDFELFDVTGKAIRKISSLNENRFELDREDMSAGVYFYRITTVTRQWAYGRLVVE